MSGELPGIHGGISGISSVEAKPSSKKNPSDRLREACEEFEAIFVRQLLKEMREALPEASLFGNGVAGQFYSELFDWEIAKSVSKSSSLGLADVVFEQLSGFVRDTGGAHPERDEKDR